MAVFFGKFLVKRRETAAKIRAINHRANVKLLRSVLGAWVEHVWAIMPIKVNQRQRAYFIAVRTERRLIARVLKEYFEAIRAMRGRSEVATKNHSRYVLCGARCTHSCLLLCVFPHFPSSLSFRSTVFSLLSALAPFSVPLSCHFPPLFMCVFLRVF